jgi:hypothetical protein
MHSATPFPGDAPAPGRRGIDYAASVDRAIGLVKTKSTFGPQSIQSHNHTITQTIVGRKYNARTKALTGTLFLAKPTNRR